MEYIIQILTIAASAFALYKSVNGLATSKRSRLWKESKYAKQLVETLNANAHPYVIEMTYRAISGGTTLAVHELKFLLSLSSPTEALDKFQSGRRYLQVRAEPPGVLRVVFAPSYTTCKLTFLKRRKLALYFVSALVAFLPLIFAPYIFGQNWKLATIIIIAAMTSFGLLAYSSLAEYGRICRAEELVDMR